MEVPKSPDSDNDGDPENNLQSCGSTEAACIQTNKKKDQAI